jgi:hypothetical protein
VPTPDPDDLIATAVLCHDAMAALVDRDWSARAGELDWSCRTTLEHLCALAYAPVLATRATAFRPLALAVTPDVDLVDLLWTAKVMAVLLAEVARAAPPTARAHHAAGPADAEGFVAMGMDELLVHTYDVASGLGADFAADGDLARVVLDRLFPWWPRGADPWSALLWSNGRIVLPGHGKLGAEWLWHSPPVREWDGTIPRWDPVANRPASQS